MDQTLRRLCPHLPAPQQCPSGAVVGLCFIERVLSLEQLHLEQGCGPACEVNHVDTCRLSPFALGPFCNVISAVVRLPQPVECDGQVGCWQIPQSLRENIVKVLFGSGSSSSGDSSPALPVVRLMRAWASMSLPRSWPLPWAMELADGVERPPVPLCKRDTRKKECKPTPPTKRLKAETAPDAQNVPDAGAQDVPPHAAHDVPDAQAVPPPEKPSPPPPPSRELLEAVKKFMDEYGTYQGNPLALRFAEAKTCFVCSRNKHSCKWESGKHGKAVGSLCYCCTKAAVNMNTTKSTCAMSNVPGYKAAVLLRSLYERKHLEFQRVPDVCTCSACKRE